MINLYGVSKMFPGVPRPAVDHLDLEVPTGQGPAATVSG